MFGIALVLLLVLGLLAEVTFTGFVGIVGALVGLLYPPKNRFWALLQKAGFLFLGAACLSLIAALVASRLEMPPSMLNALIVLSAVFLLAYTIMGNVCRRFHERT